MKRKMILASAAVAVVLVFGACSGGGDGGLNIDLPSPSALPDYEATGGTPVDDLEALDIFIAAAGAIGDSMSGSSPAVVPMKGFTPKSVTPKVVDSGDEEFGPYPFSNDPDMIPGAVSTGSIYMRNKWYYMDEDFPMETTGDYDQMIMDFSLNANLTPGITSGTMTVKGIFVIIADMNMKTVTDSYVDLDDYQYTTQFSMEAGIGYALSVSDTAGKGGKFIFSASFAASGSFIETPLEIGEIPVEGVTATLYVYDNSNNLLRSIEMADEEVEYFFSTVMDL